MNTVHAVTALLDSLPAAAADVSGDWPGVVQARGVTLQAFPADRRLPALAPAVAPSQHPLLQAALNGVVPGARITAVTAEPLRYKPGDRCVLRYHLTVEHDGHPARHGVIGKLYRERAEAVEAAPLLRRLETWPWSPRVLCVVESLGLVLTEDVGHAGSRPPTLGGLHVLRPAARSSPARPLAAAAGARAGRDESLRARRRGETLAAYAPSASDRVGEVVSALEARLAALPPAVAGPAHGSYKPSQQLFRDGRVFVIDFDQFCSADPALDVGYFRAYLRPAGYWHRRAGTRSWFEAAARSFDAAYVDAACERGVPVPVARGIVARASIYEAALLLKIAARRPNRLHASRPGEVAAVLDDVVRCLSRSESV